MQSVADVISASKPFSRVILVCYLVVFAISMWIWFGARGQQSVIAVTGLLFIASLAILFGAIGLLVNGPSKAPAGWLAAGWAYIVGGVLFDIVATLIHTPDLSLEANLIARLLLDRGYSVAFVYGYSGVMQSLLVADMCLLWAAFLRHRRTWLDLSYGQCGQSFGRFIKAASGGGRLTWRQWFFPYSLNELPSAYELILTSIPLLMIGILSRWYYGFNWFGVLPWLSDLSLFLIVAAVAMGAFFGWLYREFKACRDQRLPLGNG